MIVQYNPGTDLHGVGVGLKNFGAGVLDVTVCYLKHNFHSQYQGVCKKYLGVKSPPSIKIRSWYNLSRS